MSEREPQISLLDKHISRRDLLKGAVILAGGAYFAEACGEEIHEFSTIVEKAYPLVWQTEFDHATTIYRILPKEQIEVVLSFDEKYYEKSIIDPRSGEETGRSGLPEINVLGDGPELLPKLEEIKTPGILYTGLFRDSWNLPDGYIYPDLYGDVVIARSTETEGKVLDYEHYAAFDFETGALLWKKKFGFNGRHYFNETGFYDTGGDNVEFGSYILNIEIRRIDIHTGKVFWSKENVTKSEVVVPLWADNNNLVVVSNHDVVSLNNQNGKVFGKLKFDGPVFTIDPFTAVNDYFKFNNHLEDYDVAVGQNKVFLPIYGRLVELEKVSGMLTYVNVADNGSVNHATMLDNLLIVSSGRELYAYNIAG